MLFLWALYVLFAVGAKLCGKSKLSWGETFYVPVLVAIGSVLLVAVLPLIAFLVAIGFVLGAGWLVVG